MFADLSPKVIWAATAVLMVCVGCFTAAVITGHAPGGDLLTVVMSIITAVTGVGVAHVVGNAASNLAVSSQVPGPSAQAPTAPAPGASPVGISAMPHGA